MVKQRGLDSSVPAWYGIEAKNFQVTWKEYVGWGIQREEVRIAFQYAPVPASVYLLLLFTSLLRNEKKTLTVFLLSLFRLR